MQRAYSINDGKRGKPPVNLKDLPSSAEDSGYISLKPKPLIFSKLKWHKEKQLPPEIPIINFKKLTYEMSISCKTQATVSQEQLKFKKALINSGFFYIKNFGITQKELQDFCNVSRKFLAKDEEFKKKYYYQSAMQGYTPLGKESIASATGIGKYPDYCEKLSWQENLPMFPDREFSQIWKKTFNQLKTLAQILLKHIVTVLNLNEEQKEVINKILDGVGVLRYLHYAVIPEDYPEEFRLAPHNDVGFITILFQTPSDNGLSSLEAEINGEYVPIPAIEGTLAINLGEALSFISQGLIKSTKHRVTVPPGGYRGEGSQRDTAPFFYLPHADTILTPVLESTFKEHSEEKGIKFSEFLSNILSKLHEPSSAPVPTIKPAQYEF